MPAPLHPAVVIIGPTASGKSSLAMRLARLFTGEILSCDALQVYREMNIGTAKPTQAERAAVPHHLIDVRDPGEDFSAGDYQRLGRETLGAIRGRGSVPFVVGGTGFYLRALIDGLFEGPSRSPELRARMRRIVQRRGSASLHRALARVDSAAAARIAPADTSRIVRAYEVWLMTGRPMSAWQEQPTDRLAGFHFMKLALRWPREELYRRIDARVVEMFQRGFVEEVDRLLRRFPRHCHAFKAIGYRQIVSHLEGALTLDQAVEDTQRESRRYAKRQETWFRADPQILWIDASLGPEHTFAAARRRIETFLRG